MTELSRDGAVNALLNRFEQEPPHVIQVAKLAVILFDELRSLHRLPPKDRKTLEYAALLHDLGWYISGKKHHKHSQRLIMEHLGEPFTPEEVRLIATIARYHRKSPPKADDDFYCDLTQHEQYTCRRLAALLRIADGLDRSHRAVVHAIKARIGEKQVELHLSAKIEPKVEIGILSKKIDLFIEEFQREPVALAAEIDQPTQA